MTMKAKIKKVFRKWALTDNNGMILYSAMAEDGGMTVRNGEQGDRVAEISVHGDEMLITMHNGAVMAELTRTPCAYAPMPDKVISVVLALNGGYTSMIREGSRWHISRDGNDVGEIHAGILSVTVFLSDAAEDLAGLLLGLYAMIDQMESIHIE